MKTSARQERRGATLDRQDSAFILHVLRVTGAVA